MPVASSSTGGAQAEDDAPAMLDEATGAVDEFLHHGLDAPALGRMAYRRIGPQQPSLAHQMLCGTAQARPVGLEQEFLNF